MLDLKNVSKTYVHKNQRVEVIKNLNASLQSREFIAMVGPSGCGKSTLLKIIAGLAPATSGEVRLDGKHIHGPGKDRGLVFQNFTLFPWLKVKDNIAFGLNLRKVSAQEKNKTIEHYLRITGLTDFAEFYPKNLSGGMQQRVAIARTLANNPKILLMDEPFASLDTQTRSQMQEFLVKLAEKERTTVLFVTHDIEEAIFLADKVAVLSSRPSNIKKTFPIPFPRPRLHELKYSQAFFDLKKQIAACLEQGAWEKLKKERSMTVPLFAERMSECSDFYDRHPKDGDIKLTHKKILPGSVAGILPAAGECRLQRS